ncbi:discoidin domain-containing protein [Bacteroidales bacterium OttesenSCG-928-A17]|nr:discoidin domain-containing protein [Bacteroidales bacterium OttesenSCG-928-A17]
MKHTHLLVLCILFGALPAFSQNVKVYTPIPSDQVAISASSSHKDFPATAVVDGSGMKGRMHVSHNLGKDMWISDVSTSKVRANAYTREGVVWLLVELKTPTRIDFLQIWNHNQNQHTRRGLKKVYLEYSSDGKTWKTLKNGRLDYHIIDQSRGKALEPADFSLETGGVLIKYLCITADIEEGNHYHDRNDRTLREATDMNQNIDYYGLSEIRFYQKENKPLSALESVGQITFTASQGYLKMPDGPTREYLVQLDAPLYCGGELTLESKGKQWTETIRPNPIGVFSLEGKFPAGYMNESSELNIRLQSRQGTFKETIRVPAARKWEVHFLPHSHQDIGYTHHQDDVMKLQWRNLERAMELSARTANYPEGSRFKWNSEATWSVKGYLDYYQGTEKAEKLIEAIRKGNLGVDASLGSILTGICKQEELMHIFDDAHLLSQQTGVEFNTTMMSDVPGQSWGFVTALAQNGVKYYSPAPNYVPFWGKTGCDRAAIFHVKWGDVPFYWQSQSGADKVLCWQTGKGYSWFHGWLIGSLSSCGIDPIWEYLGELEAKEFPYDMTYLRYTVNGDNGPPDESMPDIIREWNEKYESPQFHINTTKEFFTGFEKKFGDYLPIYSGDMTPVWEDGAASTARELATNRSTSERLNQTEILWSILNPGQFPANDFREAWKNVVLFSEHTWGASASGPEPESKFTKDLWQKKKSYADSAAVQSEVLFQKALAPLSASKEHNNYIQVINTNLWTRSDIVKINTENDLSGKILLSPSGELTPVQKMNDGQWIFLAKNIPPLASSVYRIVDDRRKKKDFQSFIQDNILDNGIIRLEINKTTGTISSLCASGDSYNYAGEEGLNDYIYSDRMSVNVQKINSIRRITVLNDGEVAATLRIESDAPGCHSLERDITVYKDLGRIDITNTLDKINTYQREHVRFAFPFHMSNAEITMDLAMSEMHPEQDQLIGSNKNFYSIQNGIGINNLKHGIYLTTIDAPFIELGEMTAEEWRKESKGMGWLASALLSTPTVYSWVMNNSWGTNYKASQSGEVSFNYSLELADPYDMRLKKQAWEQAQKLVGTLSGNSSPVDGLFSLTGENQIALSTIKPSDDGSGYIVRLQNMSDNTAHSSIKWGSLKVKQVHRCDNREQITGNFDDTSFWIKPFECITLKIILNQ